MLPSGQQVPRPSQWKKCGLGGPTQSSMTYPQSPASGNNSLPIGLFHGKAVPNFPPNSEEANVPQLKVRVATQL